MRGAAFFGALPGVWRVRRRVRDLRAGQWFAFEGLAEIARAAQEAGALEHREAGRLSGGAFSGSAEQTRLWRLEAGGAVALAYADGAPLVRFSLEAETAVSTEPHLCGADRYVARLRAEAGACGAAPLSFGRLAHWRLARWRLSWRVTGPRKDYVSVTTYRRRTGA